MNEIQWTATRPVKPGLYPYTGENCKGAYVMQVKDCPGGPTGQLLTPEVNYVREPLPLCSFKGHWGPRIDFAPYVPPAPPTIEAWVCEKDGRLYRAIESGECYTLQNESNEYLGTFRGRAYLEGEGYTNWRKLKVTTEWDQ